MTFSSHPKFDRELEKFLQKHQQNDSWLFNLQNILIAHFEKKIIRLPEKKLAQLGEFHEYALWKVIMAVGGIRQNQCPRVCFSKINSEIIFLCFGTHVENYTTSQLFLMGREKLKEMIRIDSI